MILDIDTGIDDALALAYALGCEDINLLGVVGSYGNVSLDKGIENSLNLLKLLGKEDIPVYAGENAHLLTILLISQVIFRSSYMAITA